MSKESVEFGKTHQQHDDFFLKTICNVYCWFCWFCWFCCSVANRYFCYLFFLVFFSCALCVLCCTCRKPFWDKVFNQDKNLSGLLDKEADKELIEANDNKKYLPKELGFDGSKIEFPLKRFETQLSKLRERGFVAFESGVLPMPGNEYNMRIQFQSMFEGPDVFCDDTWTTDPSVSAVKDGHLDTINGFGRLEIDPYPYCLKFVWDAVGKDHDHAEVPSWGDHKYRLQELWNMQCRPDVIRMKNVRLQLRGAYCSKALFYNPFERDEQKTRQVKDGKDSEGKQKYKTEHYTVHWKYQNGLVKVGTDFGGEFEQGFKISMSYSDGEGIETSGSHRGNQLHNGHFTMGSNAMGINHQNYQMTPQLSLILGTNTNSANAQNVQRGIGEWMNALKNQRIASLKERYWENYSLSWTFWYLVYNNDMISLNGLKSHFESVEQNPKLKDIVETYGNELAAITDMISFYNSHPCVGFWYTYWNDIFKMNGDLPGIKDNADLFDPSVSTSICFKPMGRKETEEYLATCEGDDAPLGKKQEEHLDRLFARVDDIKEKHPLNNGEFPIGSSEVDNPMSNEEEKKNDHTALVVKSKSGGTSSSNDSVFVDFAANPVAAAANPKNVTIINDFSPGSAVWATK